MPVAYAGRVRSPTPQPGQHSGPVPDPRPERRRLVRRPRLVPFLTTGAILGFAVGGLVALLNQPAAGTVEARRLQSFSDGSLVGLLGLFGAAIGLLLAAFAYLWADRRS